MAVMRMQLVSLMMTPAHVLRLGSTPEPEKVNPLVPRQQGDNLLRLQPSEWCLYEPGCHADVWGFIKVLLPFSF